MMAGHLLFVEMGLKSSFLCILGKPAHFVAFQDVINILGRNLYTIFLNTKKCVAGPGGTFYEDKGSFFLFPEMSEVSGS